MNTNIFPQRISVQIHTGKFTITIITINQSESSLLPFLSFSFFFSAVWGETPHGDPRKASQVQVSYIVHTGFHGFGVFFTRFRSKFLDHFGLFLASLSLHCFFPRRRRLLRENHLPARLRLTSRSPQSRRRRPPRLRCRPTSSRTSTTSRNRTRTWTWTSSSKLQPDRARE